MAVQKGYNSDISYKGSTFHVQTQDWGYENPYIVSQIFCKGAVVKTVKISYTKVLPDGGKPTPQVILIAMQAQHQSVLDLLLSGHIDKL